MDGAALTSDLEFRVERRLVFQTGGGCALSERAARAARRGRCSSSRLESSPVVGPWFEGASVGVRSCSTFLGKQRRVR